MLVIRIELWSGGRQDKKKDLGMLFIVNTGSGTKSLGNYEVMLSKWGHPDVPWRVGSVAGFDRLRGSPWDLMRRAIIAATGQRNQDHGLRQRMVRVARRALYGQSSMFEREQEAEEGEQQFGTPPSEGLDT
jgi:hypothetical protein